MLQLLSHTFYMNFFAQLANESMIQLQVSPKRLKMKDVTDKEYTKSSPSSRYIHIKASEKLDNRLHEVTVYMTSLTENDYKFHHQPAKGLSSAHEFAVYAARVSQVNRVVMQVQLTDESGVTLASGTFTLIDTSSQSRVHVSLVNQFQDEIASIVLDYSIILPFQSYDSSLVPSDWANENGAIAWKNRSTSRETVHSGHRGLGVGTRYNVSTYHSICENTIASFDYACESGGQMVELDVSLTRDKVIPVYHDLQLVHEKTSQTCSIKDLKYEDILTHEYQPIDGGKGTHLSYRNESNLKLTLFPKLRQVFQSVRSNCAINVEVKSPYPIEGDEDAWHPHEPIDLNEYVDRILTEVFIYAGDREIVFSSFSPDVCFAIRLKQRKYPVLQLTERKQLDPPSRDGRRVPSRGILWAAAADLEGVNCYGEWMIDGGASRANLIRDQLNLILYAWQGSLSVSEINRLIDYDLDGLCYDLLDLKIGSTKKRRRQLQRSTVENEDETSKLDYETLLKSGKSGTGTGSSQHLITSQVSRNSSGFLLNPDSSITSVDLISNKPVIVQT